MRVELKLSRNPFRRTATHEIKLRKKDGWNPQAIKLFGRLMQAWPRSDEVMGETMMSLVAELGQFISRLEARQVERDVKAALE